MRPAPGFEVDGVISVSPRPVLVEIKTAFSAATVYTAVGQLMLYRRMLCSDGSHRLALVLPRAPSAPLGKALTALGFLVCVYRRVKNDAGSDSIVFDDTLRRLYAPEGAPPVTDQYMEGTVLHG